MNETMIDHELAIRELMAERYLLGELNESERAAYEAHLFECQVCFEQVRLGSELVGQISKIGAEATNASLWKRLPALFFQPVALSFAALFFCTLGWNFHQASVIRMSKTPHVVAVVTLSPESRGDSKIIKTSTDSTFDVRVVFPPDAKDTLYRAEIISASGKEISNFVTPALQPGELQIRFPAGTLLSGKYLLVIQREDGHGSPDQALGRFPFELVVQD